ncbi:MAG: 50S ribosomal protein L16 [Patescibacteria group bacterium]
MLQPKRVKHRKWKKGVSIGIETRGTTLVFGTYGLKSMGSSFITARQLEAARRTILRYLKKGGKFWIRIFPDNPVTSKGSEVPMGGGKGMVDHYAAHVNPGRIIFELEGLKEEVAKVALGMAADKLSVKTKFVKR